MLQKILEYKPGAAFYMIGGLVLFIAMALFTQYKMKGRVDLAQLIDREADRKPFWDRNTSLEYVDSYPNTSLVMVRDRQTGRTGMLDLAVMLSAQVRALPCDDASGFDPEIIYPGAAGGVICFAIDKPDTGAGDLYTFAAGFTAKAKDSQVAEFYRKLFTDRGKRVTVVQDSSRGTILEAEDEHENTVARISVRGSSDTAYGVLAWTKEFH